jgi:class 3 adenylate cyclase/pimeloyl-ACP methyl ester carboxylesterase
VVAVPETRYVKTDDGGHLAYQVCGNGPHDLVMFGLMVSHLELDWELPELRRFLDGVSTFCRLIRFDKRGVGLSDPVSGGEFPTLERRMQDLCAVLDAVGSQRTVLLGTSEGGQTGVLFAATYPDRTSSLILHSSLARSRRDPVEYPEGIPENLFESFLSYLEETWGSDALIDLFAPSVADDARLRQWWAEYSRRSTSLGGILTQLRINRETDTRYLLPSVQAPTLVLHARDEQFVRVGHGRYLAQHIPGARMVELDGGDHFFFFANREQVMGEIQQFVTGERDVAEHERVLATILFTDIVASTEHAARLGDTQWKSLLQAHDLAVRRQLDRFSGQPVKATGDGVLATFDGPARAVRCACAIRDLVRRLGIEVRVGVHAGEVELVGDDIAGIAVHVAQRIQTHAQPNEVLVSSTIKDLVAGSGLTFDDRGTHRLKGIEDDWHIYSVRS